MSFSVTRFSVLALASGLGLASCSKPDESAAPTNRITLNNFEAMDGWGEPIPSLTNVQAHSGRYAIKVDKDVEYSMGYTNSLGAASSTKIKKLIVHSWVYADGPGANAVLVVQVTVPEKNNRQLFWQATELTTKEPGKTKEWQEVTQEYTLPDSVDAAHQLKVYMWRRGSDHATYLDDLEIRKEN